MLIKAPELKEGESIIEAHERFKETSNYKEMKIIGEKSIKELREIHISWNIYKTALIKAFMAQI